MAALENWPVHKLQPYKLKIELKQATANYCTEQYRKFWPMFWPMFLYRILPSK